MRKQFITLAPSEGEMDLIRALYERSRSMAVLNGEKPSSLSRFLITTIIEATAEQEGSK